MRKINFVKSSLILAFALIAFCATNLTAKANAQVVVGVGAPPVCAYGYYGYAPYACAPAGYYGAGYFHNGIFLGVGPWAGWGYRHGWGGYRYAGPVGGRYYGRGGWGYRGSRGGGYRRR